MRRLATLGTAALCALLLCGCKYGLEEFLYHGETVKTRADTLAELDSFADAPRTGVAYDEHDAGTWNGTQRAAYLAGLGNKYTVLVIADPHFGKPKVRHDDEFLAWLDTYIEESGKPAFCLSLGDSADHGTKDEMQDYMRFVAKIEGHGIPVFTIVGNHDLYNSGWKCYCTTIWPRGTSFYHFETKGFSYYALDSGSGTLGAPQLKALEKAMAADPKPKIVLTHYPVYGGGARLGGYYTMQNTEETTRLITLFAERDVRLVLEGHTHTYLESCIAGNLFEYNVPGFVDACKWTVIAVDEQGSGSTWQALISLDPARRGDF